MTEKGQEVTFNDNLSNDLHPPPPLHTQFTHTQTPWPFWIKITNSQFLTLPSKLTLFLAESPGGCFKAKTLPWEHTGVANIL